MGLVNALFNLSASDGLVMAGIKWEFVFFFGYLDDILYLLENV